MRLAFGMPSVLFHTMTRSAPTAKRLKRISIPYQTTPDRKRYNKSGVKAAVAARMQEVVVIDTRLHVTSTSGSERLVERVENLERKQRGPNNKDVTNGWKLILSSPIQFLPIATSEGYDGLPQCTLYHRVAARRVTIGCSGLPRTT